MAQENEKQSAAQQNEIRQIVEHAVAQSLQAQMPQLQSQIVQQVLEALARSRRDERSQRTLARRRLQRDLVQAVASIHAGSTQKEILRALLDAASAILLAHCTVCGESGSRVRMAIARFWRWTKRLRILPSISAPAQSHTLTKIALPRPGNIAEMGRRFVEQFGAPVK